MTLTEENIKEEFEKSLKSLNECIKFCKKRNIKFQISDEDDDLLYSNEYSYRMIHLSNIYKIKKL